MLGIVDQVVLANTPEDPGTNTLVIFILLVTFVLLRARCGRPTSRRGTSPRDERRSPRLLRHPLARVLRYGGIAALLALGLLLPQFEDLPSRLIDYSTVLVFLMVAVSADRAHRLGQAALPGAVRVRRPRRTSRRTTRRASDTSCACCSACCGASASPSSSRLPRSCAWALSRHHHPRVRAHGERLLCCRTASTRRSAASGRRWSHRRCSATTSPPTRRPTTTSALPSMIVIVIVAPSRRTGMGRSLLAVRDNETNAAAYTVSPTGEARDAFCDLGRRRGLCRGTVRGRARRRSPTAPAPADRCASSRSPWSAASRRSPGECSARW